ncbi:peptidoglycan DD-metalloendopeptidase family protein [Falsihalocynthiibacter sp. SS001]|uniref:peptidoglycan DD-metalloendopeptidase family protein n=1 Tax=Falsihalocynthiibacter sp. SS001 TaxID=3349698 RepID=UPI0036D323EC
MQKSPTRRFNSLYRVSTLTPRILILGGATLALTACSDGFNTDLRGNFGNSFTTSSPDARPTEPKPQADPRGVISYPSYQVVLARKGDTVSDVAARVGVNAAELASYNGVNPTTKMREGELLALPRRVAEPAVPTTSSNGSIDITTLAGDAIERAGPATTTAVVTTPPKPSTTNTAEPVRHKVERGETAYSIARLYNVSVRSLSEWNGLGSDLAVREGQFLLIPLPDQDAPKTAATTTLKQPGQGTATPTPPSASAALPAAIPPAPTAPASPELGAQQTQATAKKTELLMPVSGKIIRGYSKGKNDGIDISASAGTAIKAAEAGKVAAVTEDTDGVTIIVIRHASGLLTVYANVEGVTVQKGSSVTRGQNIGKMRAGSPPFMHFEVRQGFDSVDPTPYVS